MTAQSTTALRFVDILGGRFTVSPDEFLLLLNTATTRTYLGAVYVLLLATDAPGVLGKIHILLVLALWVGVLGTFVAAAWATLTVLAWAQRLTPVRLWPGPLIVICALTPAVIAGEALFYLASDDAIGFTVVPDILFFWLIAEMFGLIFFRYVRPHIELENATPAVILVDSTERSVIIGAEPVPLARLRHIEAREHHVHVTLDGESQTYRARLSDIVAQTGPEDGFQPHRSWWVAANAARILVREGARHVLELDDGTRVPVARSRVDDVRRRLDRAA